MQPNLPEPAQPSSSADQPESHRPSSNLLRFLKRQLDEMDCGPEGLGEIWLVDDTTGEVLDRAIVRKKPVEEAKE